MVVGRRQLHYTGCSLRCNLMLLIKKFVVLMKSEISTLSWQRIVFWGYPKFHSSHFFIFMVRNSILIRSNKMQPYAGIYLLQNYMFRVSSHPSSGVHKTVTAASATGHITYQGNNLPRWRKVVAMIRDMTCTRSCSYSFMYSWWWAR